MPQDSVLPLRCVLNPLLPRSATVDHLKGVVASSEATPIKVVTHVRPKGQSDAAVFAPIIDAVRKASSAPVVGVVQKDAPTGSFAAGWEAVCAADFASTVDISAGVEASLLMKDSASISQLVEASSLTVRLFRKVMKSQILSTLEDGKAVTHDKLAKTVENALQKLPSIGVTQDPLFCDLLMRPLVQSGGKYSLKLHSTDGQPTAKLQSDVIMLSLGGLYRSYGAAVARTLLVDPTKGMESAYKSVLEAQNLLIDALRPGVVIGTAVKEAQKHLAGALPGATLPRSFGYSVGLRVREGGAAGSLTADNHNTVQSGQCFFVLVGATNIPITDGSTKPKSAVNKLKDFALCIGDTVICQSPDTAPTVTTSKAGKELRSVSFELEGETSEEESAEESSEGEGGEGRGGARRRRGAATGAGEVGRGTDGRSARLAAKKAELGTDEGEAARRAEHQQDLFLAKVQAMRAAAAQGGGEQAEEAAPKEVKPIEAYTSTMEFPTRADPCRITVDKERESVLLPMYGSLVPFHISTIKSVSTSDESGKTYLRVNFYNPGQAVGKDCPPAMAAAVAAHPHLMFIRTLNFASADPRNMNLQVRLIKELQKRARTRRTEAAELRSLVKQPRLVIDRTQKISRMRDVNMWPVISGRKCIGSLEAHVNGLRFVTDKREVLEIIYQNVKHAIFQPCEREHTVLLHFHLRHPILVGKKKRKDIQFYTDVVDSSQALDGKRRSMYDPDEQLEEQRERQARAQLNKAFKRFVEKVQLVAEGDRSGVHNFLFDSPSRDIAFPGVPGKEMVTLMPCGDCLVSLSERPPFVLSMASVEHVHFERVLFSSKNFDMVCIFKEGVVDQHAEQFVRISAIPMTDRDQIQHWLDVVVDVTFTQGPHTINWKSFIKERVRRQSFWASEDSEGNAKPVAYMELVDVQDEAEEEEEEGGSEFTVSGDEEEEDDDDDDEFSDAVTDEGSEEDFSEEDEEEGDTWEDLEAQARAEDSRGHLGAEPDSTGRGTKRGRVQGEAARSGKRSRR